MMRSTIGIRASKNSENHKERTTKQMKKRLIVFLSFMLPVILFGADNQTPARKPLAPNANAKSATTKSATQAFNEAVALFQSRNYQAAYDRLLKLYFESKDNFEIALFTGLAAFETRRFDVAIGALSQALTIDHASTRAKLELARAYFATDQFDLAKDYFEQVKRAKPAVPDSVKHNVDSYLAAIEDRQRRSRFSSQLMMIWGYDSNINQTANDPVSVKIGGWEFEIDDDIEPDSMVTLGSFNDFTYDFGELGGFKYIAGANVYTSKYTMATANDLLLAGIKTGVSADVPIGRFVLPIEYDHVEVDRKSYVDVFSVGVNYDRVVFDNSGLCRAHIKWTERVDTRNGHDNFDKSALLDTHGWEVGIGLQKVFEGLDLSVGINGAYASQRSGARLLRAANRTLGDKRPETGHSPISELDYYTLNLSAGYISRAMSYGARAGYRHSGYENGYALFENEKRTDEAWNGELYMNYSFAPQATLMTNIGYQDNRSTLDYYNYDKITAQVGFVFSWGG
jgi:tetratricopeptide (TPR) repeat protein